MHLKNMIILLISKYEQSVHIFSNEHNFVDRYDCKYSYSFKIHRKSILKTFLYIKVYRVRIDVYVYVKIIYMYIYPSCQFVYKIIFDIDVVSRENRDKSFVEIHMCFITYI